MNAVGIPDTPRVTVKPCCSAKSARSFEDLCSRSAVSAYAQILSDRDMRSPECAVTEATAARLAGLGEAACETHGIAQSATTTKPAWRVNIETPGVGFPGC